MALPSPPGSDWRIGERIHVRGADWIVLERTVFRDCVALRLAGGDRASPAAARRTLLVPFDRPRRLVCQRTTRIERPRRWLHGLRRTWLDDRPFGSLTQAGRSGIDILPYQLEPALAILRQGATRILIADAVGLGKTIQAGLLLSELSGLQDGFRALVVAPAGLRDQWRHELDRFHLPSIAADTHWLRQAARDLPVDLNPWLLPGVYVVSLDLLKRPEVLRPIEDASWDVLVVDEAHGAAPGTQRFAAICAIAARARRVLLLTATPHLGDSQQFAALCRIGEIDRRTDPLVIFNRTRADVGLPHRRRSSLRAIRLSPAEVRMHRLLDRYTEAISREAVSSHARLAAIVLRKRALSSAGSLAASVGRRMALLAELPIGECQLSLPLDDDDVEDEAPDAVLGAPGLADAHAERQWLEAIRDAAAGAAAAESKIRFLTRLLARWPEPAIVFTEYRDTLARLQEAIAAAGRSTVALHGGLTPSERGAVQRVFNETEQVLLATDAAAEGLNLHGRCRTVVHFELPWSPIRLEQRVGRVDRIGQHRTVHEIALIADDTAERLVLAPLARRAARAHAALGSRSGSLAGIRESRIAAAVLDGSSIADLDEPDALAPSAPALAAPPATASDGTAEACRLLRHRAWTTMSGTGSRDSHEPSACLITALAVRGSGIPPGVTAVYSIVLTTSGGQVVHRHTVAATTALPVKMSGRQPRDVRAAFSGWLREHEPAVRAAVAAAERPRLDRIRRMHAVALEALDRREAAMAARLSSGAQQIVQASLFDQRALRHAAARQRVLASLVEESDRRASARSDRRRVGLAIELSGVLFAIRR